MPKNNPLTQVYDQEAASYDKLVADIGYIGPAWLSKNLSDPFCQGKVRALDLGCANGINGSNLRKINEQIEIVGVDISPLMIEEAKQKGIYSSLHVHDMENPLPFLVSESFDLVVALGFLEFVASIDSCLDEIVRLMKHGAELYASFQLLDPSVGQYKTRDVVHYPRTQEEIELKFKKRNLKIQSLESVIGYANRDYHCPYLMVHATK